jgi:hypothetical protein
MKWAGHGVCMGAKGERSLKTKQKKKQEGNQWKDVDRQEDNTGMDLKRNRMAVWPQFT